MDYLQNIIKMYNFHYKSAVYKKFTYTTFSSFIF